MQDDLENKNNINMQDDLQNIINIDITKDAENFAKIINFPVDPFPNQPLLADTPFKPYL